MSTPDAKSRPDGQFDPRDIQAKNVAGSTAGAGSGDFHVYRHQRRLELDRIANMEREAKEKEERENSFLAAEARRLKEVSRTTKRAAKRRRKKELRQNRKKMRPAVEAVQPGVIISATTELNTQSPGKADNPDENNTGDQPSPDMKRLAFETANLEREKNDLVSSLSVPEKPLHINEKPSL